MRALVFSILTALSLSLTAQNSTDLDKFFLIADHFFGTYVEDGLVDYKALKSQPQQLNSLVKMMAEANLSTANEATYKAFYINAYNITMIKSLVEKYPIKSPLDDNNIFTGEKHNIAGEGLTLEKIEKQKLNPGADPRLHFVLVCGALGCPPLANFAYKPDMVEQQIAAQTKVALNNDQFVRVDAKNNTVAVSEIFNWYAKDFAGQSTIAYLNQYRTSKIPADYKVTNYTYDWSINGKK